MAEFLLLLGSEVNSVSFPELNMGICSYLGNLWT